MTTALTLLVKSTLLVAVTLGLSRGLRTAAGRHLALSLGLAGAVVMPIGVAILPALDLPILPAATSPDPVESGAVSTPPATAAGIETPIETLPPLPLPAAPELNQGRRLAGWALLVSGISLGWLAYAFAGILATAWRTRHAEDVSAGDQWIAVLAAVRSAAGVARPVRLLCTDAVSVPCTWGVLRPDVLVPPESRDWSDEERRDALAHEMAHIARFDWATHLLARAACALHWFNPLVWVAARRLALEAERACDDAVLLAGSAPPAYAEQLLTLARRAVAAPSPRHAALVSMIRADDGGRPRGHVLSTRIHSILDTDRRRSIMKRSQVILASMLTLTVVATLSSTRIVRAAAPGGSPRLDADAATRDAAAARDAATRWISAEPEIPRSPLGVAARFGDLAAASRLLSDGADPNGTPGGDASPLMLAAEHGHDAIVELLLGRGADVDLIVGGDGTALLAAARGGHPEIVDRLLAAGADPDTAVQGDGTALINAARSGDQASLQQLLAAGADPSRFVDGDESPLYHAVSRGDRDMVEALVAAGVEVDAEIPGDGTALIVAARHGDLALVRRLVRAGADVNRAVTGDGNPLIMAAGGGHLAVVRELLGRGADIDAIVPGDENAVIAAAGSGRLAVVRYLIERGADIDVRVPTPYGVRTALGQARSGGHSEVVRALRAAGASE